MHEILKTKIVKYNYIFYRAVALENNSQNELLRLALPAKPRYV